ncbi:lytic murein transglycosylase [Maricaulis sp. CAU 1757]
MIRLVSAAIAAFALFATQAPAQPEGESFQDWLSGFRARLTASGAEPATVRSMLDGLEPDMAIIERDRSQPEFVRPIWSYLDIAASQQRIDNGRTAYAENRELINAIAARFEVRPETLVAIWGLESSYGAITGNEDVVRALATLAWEGRRRGFAEDQLIAIARMIDEGYATREQLLGSWAGAMGQTQFIPTTYLERSYDWDGDGRRNIWTDYGDALASTANLLSRAGWEQDAPAFVEVTVPDNFDFADWNPNTSKLVSQWSVQGIMPANGNTWSAATMMRPARLELPAGASGPGFLTFANFRVIKRYNNSTAYALGVALLADRIEGLAGIRGSWPENDPPITRSQTEELQRALNGLGFNAGTPDGIAGPNTRSALRAFQRSRGLVPDGYIGRAMYDAVMAATRG